MGARPILIWVNTSLQPRCYNSPKHSVTYTIILDDDENLGGGDDHDRICQTPNKDENQADEIDKDEWDNGETLTEEQQTDIMKLSIYEHQREMNMHCNKHLLAPLVDNTVCIFQAKLKKPKSNSSVLTAPQTRSG